MRQLIKATMGAWLLRRGGGLGSASRNQQLTNLDTKPLLLSSPKRLPPSDPDLALRFVILWGAQYGGWKQVSAQSRRDDMQ